MSGSLARIDQFRLSQEVIDVIMTIGQESPTCVVDLQEGVVWWPHLLVMLTGCPTRTVLGGPPPMAFPDGTPVPPFALDEMPYQGVAVTCGRLATAALTASWIGTQAQEWTLERRRVQVPVKIDLRRRPLVRVPGRVIPLKRIYRSA